MNAYEFELYKIAKERGDSVSRQLADVISQQAKRIEELEKEKDGCGNCHACLVEVMENGFPKIAQRMILCPDCGNKRCPKASNHRYKCTGSNEVGQLGSVYTHPHKELSDEEIIIIRQNTKPSSADNWADTLAFARAIEERHGIK